MTNRDEKVYVRSAAISRISIAGHCLDEALGYVDDETKRVLLGAIATISSALDRLRSKKP